MRKTDKTIQPYIHLPAASTQQPDPDPGDYYVSARDGDKFWLLSGPYVDDHAGALAMVAKVRAHSVQNYARSHFYAFGTCRTPNGGPGSYQKAGYDLSLNKVEPVTQKDDDHNESIDT